MKHREILSTSWAGAPHQKLSSDSIRKLQDSINAYCKPYPDAEVECLQSSSGDNAVLTTLTAIITHTIKEQ